MTNKSRRIIESALYHAGRAEKYIFRAETAVCHRSSGTTTLDYTRGDGKSVYEVEKEIGSDLCGLKESIKILEEFLMGAK